MPESPKFSDGTLSDAKTDSSPRKPTDPHPFVGDKKQPCQRCGGGFYEARGHWRSA